MWFLVYAEQWIKGGVAVTHRRGRHYQSRYVRCLFASTESIASLVVYYSWSAFSIVEL